MPTVATATTPSHWHWRLCSLGDRFATATCADRLPHAPSLMQAALAPGRPSPRPIALLLQFRTAPIVSVRLLPHCITRGRPIEGLVTHAHRPICAVLPQLAASYSSYSASNAREPVKTSARSALVSAACRRCRRAHPPLAPATGHRTRGHGRRRLSARCTSNLRARTPRR